MNEKKQIEEMAQDMYDLLPDYEHNFLDCRSAAEEMFARGYRKPTEWISVDERLPDVLQEVLAYRGNYIANLINVYTYVGGDIWKDEYGFGCRSEDEGITHWMPLPEPPKEKENTEK